MSSTIKLKGNGIPRIIPSKVILSPLAGVTDNIFRGFVRRWAPNSLLFTEMINATSLKHGYGSEKVSQIEYEKGPIGVQIFDNRPYAVAEAAKESEEAGAFLIDINMGCPVKKISKKGGGSALIKNPKLAVEILKKIKKAIQIPVTVKTRIGWSKYDKNIENFLLALQDAGADMVTVHGRTREQGFTGRANWEIIAALKEKLDIPVIANGDITCGIDAIKCLNETKADGVMVGRGILGSPWIIGEIDNKIRGTENFKFPSPKEKLQLLIEHIELLVSVKGEHGLLVARKHINWTCKDFENSSKLKNKLLKVNTPLEAKNLIKKFIINSSLEE